MNAKDLTPGQHLKVLVYGDSGTGKTTFAGSFPRPFFFDFDGGMMSLRGKDIEYESYDVTDPDQSKQFEKDQQTVLKRDDIDTLVYDSVSSLSLLYQATLLKLNNKTEMDLKEYGRLSRYFEKFFAAVTSPHLGKNVVCICHESRVETESGALKKVEPLVLGKMSAKVSMFFDEVYYLTAAAPKQVGNQLKSATRILSARPSRTHTAKSRIHGDLFTIEQPTYAALMKGVKV